MYPLIDDVENLVEEIFQGAAPRYSGLASFNYNKYHRFDDYQSWQADFAAENSDLVEILDYGKSFEVIDLFILIIFAAITYSAHNIFFLENHF